MINKRLWLDGAGDSYYRRNLKDFGTGTDLVMPLIERLGLKEGNALEIGCANGWRLAKLQERGMTVFGIDPSIAAIRNARSMMPKGNFVHGTADHLPFNETFSLIIVGFCMWFIEPELWFKVVTETDRLLNDRAVIIIHDFLSPRAMTWKRRYGDELEQQTTGWAHDFPKLWLGHPWYRQILENVGFRSIGKTMLLEHAACLLKDKGSIYGAELTDE